MKEKKSTHIRREEIIDAAMKVVGEKGVGALTISGIADAAGMSEANIYRHFSGKWDICIALSDFIRTNIMGKAMVVAVGSGSPLTKLNSIFTFHLSLISEHPGIPRFVFSEHVHLSNDEVSQRVTKCIESYTETLTGLVAAAINEGEISAELEPRMTALTLLAMIQFTALRWTISRASFDIQQEGRKLWENFLHMVK